MKTKQTESKHTPGPWSKAKTTGNVIDRRGCRVATIESMPGNNRAEKKANADLIAAAPDMLCILSELLKEADSTGGRLRTVTRYNVDRARAIIAKARGQA